MLGDLNYGPWGVTGDITGTNRQVKTTETEALFFPHRCGLCPIPVARRLFLSASGLTRIRPTAHKRLFSCSQTRSIWVRVSALSYPDPASPFSFKTDTNPPNRPGVVGDPTLLQTVWKLEVAKGYSVRPPSPVLTKQRDLTRHANFSQLGPDCLVCIKSCAPVKRALANLSALELALTVFRNPQGVFHPAISDSDEPSYGRIQAVGPRGSQASYSAKAEPHRHGDAVRLTWSFADQPSGFRDCYGDVYGRRSYRRPAELGPHDTLCLKVPYPRFEGADDEGVALVLSPALTEEPIVQALRIRPINEQEEKEESVERSYNLHDLSWRLDPVGKWPALFFCSVSCPFPRRDPFARWANVGNGGDRKWWSG